MKSKAYFQYYETFEALLEKITDKEKRESLREKIINYGLYGTEPEKMSEIEDMAWTICRELIDQQRHRREVNAGNAAGKRKSEPEKKKEPEKKFIKPTLEEVKAYCSEKGYKINIQQFMSYYDANGWKVGRNPMKSWQAAVQSWSARDKATGKAGTMWAKGAPDSETRSYEDLF